LCHRDQHPAIGFIVRVGGELGPDDEPHTGQLAHDRLGERAVELRLEVTARPAREPDGPTGITPLMPPSNTNERSCDASRASRASSALRANSPSPTIAAPRRNTKTSARESRAQIVRTPLASL
jgi:hypothetical protein